MFQKGKREELKAGSWAKFKPLEVLGKNLDLEQRNQILEPGSKQARNYKIGLGNVVN